MNPKPLLLLLAFSTASLISWSQDSDSIPNWKLGGMSSLTFSQVSFSKYWASGGENSLSGGAMVNLYANYKTEELSWNNTLDLGYGLIRQGAVSKKSDDRIEFSSQFGRQAVNNWNYSALASFKSQFDAGYNYPNDVDKISNFLSPAYITVSVGMDYKPGDKFNLFLSPLTGKFTIVTDDSLSARGAFGVEPGETFRAELGGFMKVSYKTPLVTNVDLVTKLDLFSNYINNPQNIDVNMEVMLNMKINEFLSATINTLLIYDDDIKFAIDSDNDGLADKKGPRLQFKEVFGLGVSYKF